MSVNMSVCISFHANAQQNITENCTVICACVCYVYHVYQQSIYIIMIDLVMHIAIKWHQNRSDILFSDNFISFGCERKHIHTCINSLAWTVQATGQLIGTAHFFAAAAAAVVVAASIRSGLCTDTFQFELRVFYKLA